MMWFKKKKVKDFVPPLQEQKGGAGGFNEGVAGRAFVGRHGVA